MILLKHCLQELKKIAEEDVEEISKKKKKKDVLDEYAVTPYGMKYKIGGNTYMLLSHNRGGFRL